MFEPVESRIDAVTGLTLIVPVRVIGGADESEDFVATSLESVRLDDGRKLTCALRWISVGPEDSSSRFGSPIDSRWLPPTGKWRTSDTPPKDPGLTMLVLAVDLPEDSAGHDLLIGRRRVRMNWLPSPVVLGTDRSGALEPAIPATLRDASSLIDLTRAERLSPVRRWRYRMLTTGLHPAAQAPVPAGEPRRFADAVLEALAVQQEARWAVAIASLGRSDAELARRLAERLCAVARFDEDVVAPVWPLEQAELDALLADLLDPAASPEVRIERCTLWLNSQPAAHAWVIDDSAERDGASRQPIARIGLVNLLNSPTLASAIWVDGADRRIGGQPELVPVRPLSAFEWLMPVAPEALVRVRRGPDEVESSAVMEVQAGEFESKVRVDASVTPAAPPSLVLGPLRADHTLQSFLSGQSTGPGDRAWSTTSALYRQRADGSQSPAAAEGEQWILFIQCARPGPQESDEPGIVTDSIRVHIGAMSQPRLLLRIEETGTTVREDNQGALGLDASVRVVREAERWLVLLTIPPGCMEQDGTMRIGLERIDARGVRTAWPRSMLPWHETSARAVIDVAAWDR